MMKQRWLLVAFMPFAAFAQPLNTTNNPNLPGYEIPSQQRMQTQMLNQQQQHAEVLNQQLQTQAHQQQQQLEAQLNNNAQRVRQAQPGGLNSGTNGGMLNQNSVSTPQVNIPLKTVTP